MSWYAIHTYSGYEEKVRECLRDRLKILGLEDSVARIIIPNEDVVELRKSKKKISNRKLFPGYVFLEMEIDDNMIQMIRNIPKVTGFIGTGNKPTPISDKEMDELLSQLDEAAKRPKPKVQFVKGEVVRIIDGPFLNFTGIIDEVTSDKGKLRVMLTIFGRSTPVELEFFQVEKI